MGNEHKIYSNNCIIYFKVGIKSNIIKLFFSLISLTI